MSLSDNNFSFLKQFACICMVSVCCQAMSMPALKEQLIFNNASIESESVLDTKVHQVVLSAPTRINNAPFIEKEQRVEGKKTVMLLRLDGKDSTSDAFTHYRALVNQNGVVAYSCENRGCGISSYWANSVFDERRLAGRDSDQYYLAGQVEMGGASFWVTIYLVTNALRQNLVYVNYILQEQQKKGWENAYLLFPDNKLPSAVAQTLKDKLSKDLELKLFVAGYSKLDLKKNISVSEANLMSAYGNLEKELAAVLALPSERIMFRFVGPFHSEPPVEKDIWFRLFLLRP